jgi:hypothetical protein
MMTLLTHVLLFVAGIIVLTLVDFVEAVLAEP